jgi:predicted nucleic acid-binding protein
MVSIPTPSRVRVFVDTSVLFAGPLSGSGFARDLILAGAHGILDLVVSQFVVLETRRNLEKKAPQALLFFEAFLTSDLVRSVEPTPTLVRQAAMIVTLKEAPVVAAARAAEALALATYDRKHLLAHAAVIQDRFGIIVETPEAVLNRIE